MSKKAILLKKLGWNDALIKHFKIDDSGYVRHPQNELITKTNDTTSFIISYNINSANTVSVIDINIEK